MIRFMPDSWVDVLMRPLDMISPEGNIYVEVQAPDLRLAAALLLGAVVLLSSARRRADKAPALQLFALTLLAMIPWFVTSGNGRYFTPFLLLLGPLCIGLARLLPLSPSLKFSAMGLVLLLQGVLLFEAAPWGNWSLATWDRGSYFQVAAPPAQPRSYVTISPISYSLIAPQFPAESRWMNLSAPLAGERQQAYGRKWLSEAKSLYLVAPSLPSQMGADDQPSPAVLQVFEKMIQGRGLKLVDGTRCDFVPSRGLASMALGRDLDKRPADAARFGFWLCPMRYDPVAVPADVPGPADLEVEAVFDAVEKLCPRFFPAGEASTQPFEEGASRHYSSSDTRVYVLDDGEVLYKFWRSINAVTIGRRADILAGRVHLDCTKIRAGTWRSGGP